MQLPTFFEDFLEAIRLPPPLREEAQRTHSTLRERLLADEGLKPIVVTSFLQGSYRRHTGIRPVVGARPDVDVVVVTRLDRSDHPDPGSALRLFRPFLRQHYNDQWRTQNRSLRITARDGQIDLDLVVTSAPSEAQLSTWRSGQVDHSFPVDDSSAGPAWKQEPLWLPDRDAKSWREANPIGQLSWTREKNRRTNGHFVNVVKALKWWQHRHPSLPRQPRSYPLERIIAECCPDGLYSVADGVTLTLEAIGARFRSETWAQRTPVLPDIDLPHRNVLARVGGVDFANFHHYATQAARIAREALDENDLAKSVERWRLLFGDEFPTDGGGGFTPRKKPSTIGGGRFGR